MSDLDPKAKFALRKLIKELEAYRARHTELITVYVPAGYELIKIIQQLATEQGTARNIKSTGTRKNVLDALERMVRQLRLYKQTPPNGLAIFCGNVSEREGASDVRVWAIEPPTPLKLRAYRCDQTFFLDPLKDMLDIKEIYGLVVMDRREANIAYLKGKTIIPVQSFSSNVPGKFRAGGQSAHRFERVIDGLARDFFKKVADAANREFLGKKEIKGIIVGGPGPTKEDWVRGNFLFTEVKEKVIGVLDIGYTGDYGLEELVNKASDLLAKEEVIQEKQAVDRFFNVLNTRPNLAAYGSAEVEHALNAGAVDTLLVSEEFDSKKMEEFASKAEEFSGKWVLISKETREGELLINLGGVAAILRYALT